MTDQDWRQPSLDEILADPLTILLMKSDGVSPADVRVLLRKAQAARRSSDDVDTEHSRETVKHPAWRRPLAATGTSAALEAVCRCGA